ncbi:MAG: hypothetical protein HZA50_17465 [Planctomycetes bacterium]|nr:hypothetical protein [Planctomycetota bacterium]
MSICLGQQIMLPIQNSEEPAFENVLEKIGAPHKNVATNMANIQNNNTVINIARQLVRVARPVYIASTYSDGLVTDELRRTNPVAVLFHCINFQKDNNTLQIHRRRIQGPRGRQIVAPGEAQSAARRTERNPGKPRPFNEVSNLQSRRRQACRNFRQAQPKIFDATLIRSGKSKALARLFQTSPAHLGLLQQKSNELAIRIGRGIRKFSHFCRGATGALKTFLMTTIPRFRDERLRRVVAEPGATICRPFGLRLQRRRFRQVPSVVIRLSHRPSFLALPFLINLSGEALANSETTEGYSGRFV